MNVLVIGLGSMGKRRIRLIQKCYKAIKVYGVDTCEARCKEVSEKFEVEGFNDLQEAIDKVKPLAAFVCTAPLSHQKIIDTLLKQHIHVFTELNLVKEGYEKWIKREKADPILFLSSTLIYRKDIQAIIQQVSGKPVNYTYHSGQYLPDWHPWESYKDFFVGDKRTNGCREILAIELPWLVKAFGPIKRIYTMKGNLTSLELNYFDYYMLSIEHENGSKGSVCVDIVARKAMRRLEIFSEKLHMFWEGTPQSLSQYDVENKEMKRIKTYEQVDRDARYCENIIENAYMDEIDIFIEAIISGKNRCLYTLEEDFETLKWIDYVEGESI